jgi:hypothetical protein
MKLLMGIVIVLLVFHIQQLNAEQATLQTAAQHTVERLWKCEGR